ncbi:MAG: EAL domain-containing protein [Thalassolituus sp.]
MNLREFLPPTMRDDGEFLELRTVLLMKRIIGGSAIAMIFSAVALAMVTIRSGLEYWYVVAASLTFYLVPIYLAWGYLRKDAEQRNPDQARNCLARMMMMVISVWSLIGLAILPGLDSSTRVIAVSMFLVVVYAHMLPFAIFPKYALGLMALNVLPLSIQLMTLDGPGNLFFGMCGVVLLFMEVGTISWLYRSDMNVIAKHFNGPATKEPDMSVEGFRRRKVFALHNSSTPAVILQAIAAFFLVITLRTPEHEAMLWGWLVGYLSLQAMRSAGFIAHVGNARALRLRTWRLIFAVGVVANQLAWYMLLYLFHDILNGFNLGIVSGMFMVIAMISTLGLSSDRVLLYLNIALCMVPPVAIMFSGEDLWSMVSLGTLASLSMFVVAENVHRSTVFSMKGRVLQKLTEYRSRQMQSLNEELTEARERLTEVNQSLEAQVEERTQELNYQATHDMLTGLGNRYYFANKVSEALKSLQQGEGRFAVYLLDLDRFKEINDGLGHLAGDQVLTEIAARIKEHCDDERICARWGGDEFVILETAVGGEASIHQFASRLVESLRQPISLEGGKVSLGASIGVAICPEHGSSAEQLLEHADIAVYRAKSAGRGTVAIYDDQWGHEAAERLQLVQSLQNAIESDEIDVALQPFVSIEDGGLTGFEALARWRDERRGVSVSPAVFIPLAEDTGLMPALGRNILRKACKALIDAKRPDLRIAVNLSVTQLEQEDFVQDVARILAETGLHPERLELELTESLFAGDVMYIRQVLGELRSMGIRISIDDFGTGYSSISYLRDFPLDTLKIDQSFVAGLRQGGESLFSSIVSLAHGLKLSVIVEGVETRSDLEKVLDLGGEEIQGYFFARPISSEDLAAWLKDHESKPFNLRRRYLSVGS